jgi:hypothetical protein
MGGRALKAQWASRGLAGASEAGKSQRKPGAGLAILARIMYFMPLYSLQPGGLAKRRHL